MKSKTQFVGLTLFDALTVLFVALKLCGVVAWPWWAVLAPLWVPLAVLLLVIVAAIAASAARKA